MATWINLVKTSIEWVSAPAWPVVGLVFGLVMVFLFTALLRAKRLRLGTWFDFTAKDAPTRTPPRPRAPQERSHDPPSHTH